MKKLGVLLTVLVILGAVAYFVLLKKPEFILNDTTIMTVIDTFNKENPDFKIVVEKGNISVTPEKDSGLVPKYRIEVKDGEFHSSAKALFKMFSIPDADKVEDVTIIEKVSSLVMIMEPTSKQLMLRSVKGATLKTDIPDKAVGDVTLEMTIASIDMSDFDLSGIIQHGADDFQKAYFQVIIDNPKYEMTMNNLAFTMAPNKPKATEEVQAIQFNVDSAEVKTDNNKALLQMLYDNTTAIDVTPFAKQGAQRNTTSVALNNMKLNIVGKDQQNGKMELGIVSLNTSLAPSEAVNNTFMFDFVYQFNNGKYIHFNPADLEGIKAESMLSFNDIKAGVSIDKLSPKVVDFYIQLIRELQTDLKNNPKAAQDYLFGSMDEMKMAFMETEPTVTINFDPIDHSLGKGDVNGQFTFSANTMFPVGEAKANIYNVPEMIQDLLAKQLIKQKEADLMMQKLNEFFINDGAGNYNAHFQIINEPPFFLLNGNPMK